MRKKKSQQNQRSHYEAYEAMVSLTEDIYSSLAINITHL